MAAFFAPAGFRATSQSLHQAEQITTLTSQLSQARGELLNADAAAVAGELTGETGFTATAGLAAQSLAAAAAVAADSADGSPDQLAAVSDLSSQVVSYTAAVAAAGGEQQAITEASDSLRLELLPDLDAVISAQQQNLSQLQNNQNRLVVVWLAGVGVLILAASISVASRTRRVLNLGLVLGLVVTGCGISQSVDLLNTFSSDVVASQIQISKQAATAWDSVAELKDISARIAAGIAVPESTDFDTELAQLRQAQQYLADAITDPTGVLEAIDQVEAQHDAGEDAATLAGDAYVVLQDWAKNTLDGAQSQVSHVINQYAGIVHRQSLVIAGLLVAAGVSCFGGLSYAMRRYR